jgi:DNA repair protein RecN (Recombination protein N)
MLNALSIRDVVLIERLDLHFGAGLTTLTGETGAGKSILLDSLGLALGDRADTGLIRAGAAQAVVSAAFTVDAGHPATALLNEAGLDDGGGEILLRRVLGRDGRSRALVNDQPVGIALLKRVGALACRRHCARPPRGRSPPGGMRRRGWRRPSSESPRRRATRIFCAMPWTN